jgi:hypothetical protein
MKFILRLICILNFNVIKFRFHESQKYEKHFTPGKEKIKMNIF